MQERGVQPIIHNNYSNTAPYRPNGMRSTSSVSMSPCKPVEVTRTSDEY